MDAGLGLILLLTYGCLRALWGQLRPASKGEKPKRSWQHKLSVQLSILVELSWVAVAGMGTALDLVTCRLCFRVRWHTELTTLHFSSWWDRFQKWNSLSLGNNGLRRFPLLHVFHFTLRHCFFCFIPILLLSLLSNFAQKYANINAEEYIRK